MRKVIVFLTISLAITVSAQASVTVDIYSGFTGAGGGTPYTGYVGSFQSPDIMFATNTGYQWKPFDLSQYGAEITGCLDVDTTGEYSFTLNSDDGSMLYIDGGLVVDNGGDHGPKVVAGLTQLTAGVHQFKVEFYEDHGMPGGVDLLLPDGVSYADCHAVPVPGAFLLAGLGSGAIGYLRRRKSL